MTEDEFSKLLDLHGSVPDSWPSTQQEPARRLLELSAEARDLQQLHQRLETRLDRLQVPAFEGLEARVLNQALPPRSPGFVDRLLAWLVPAEGIGPQLWRPAVAACLPLVFGVVLGNYFSFGIVPDSSDVDFWEDELAMVALVDVSDSEF